MSVAKAHILRTVLLLAAVVVVNFLLPRLLPGSPVTGVAGPDGFLLPSSAQQELRHTYGLDRPLLEQFRRYLVRLSRGDLGRSLATFRPVSVMIAERLPWTILLVASSVMVSIALGAALGTAAAWRPHRSASRLIGPFAVGVGALPEFLVAMILIVVLGVRWRVFPVGGATTPFLVAEGIWGRLVTLQDLLWHVALPAATLIIGLIPAFFLLSRNALAAVVGERYLVTARGKGLPERRVLWHAWRNALPPVLTLLGLRLAFVVTGAAVVERIFAYPGMGMLLFEAVGRRDYPVMQGVFTVASAIILATNLILELTATVLNPRLRERPA